MQWNYPSVAKPCTFAGLGRNSLKMAAENKKRIKRRVSLVRFMVLQWHLLARLVFLPVMYYFYLSFGTQGASGRG
jgi:hypothetical protein